MVKSLKFLVILIAVALFGIMSVNAKAAKIYGVCSGGGPEIFSPVTSANPNFYYKVAYEVYSNTAGASSKISDVIVQHSVDLNNKDSINLILNGANFTPKQQVYYALLVDNNTTDNITQALTAINGLVGSDVTQNDYLAAITSTTISSPTANIGFIVDNETVANQNPYLFLAQVVVDNASATPVTYKVISIGSAVYVNPNLNASCSNNANIIINATMPNEKIDNQLFAKILPKCGPYTIGAGLQKLTAKLNTDSNFTSFSGGDAVVNTLTIQTCESGCGSSTCTSCNNCASGTAGGGTTSSMCSDWIVGYDYACPTTANVSFTLTSQVAEPGITVSYGPDNTTQTNCTTTDNKNWVCTSDNIPVDGSGCLVIKADGTTSLTPTTWTISNLTPTIPNATVCSLKGVNGPAGAWYGGLEAIVPFLKSGNGYETYMKLYNRYSKDADVYAAAFDKSGNMLVALTKIGTIPSAGYYQWTAAEIGNDLGLTAAQIANGFPVKLVIRVPSGKGCISGTYGVDFSEHLCYNNTNDPYVEGIVVSVTPNGQRSIPLEFKYFKNGGYSQ